MRVLVAAVMAVEHMRPEGYLGKVMAAGERRSGPEGDYVEMPDETYWALVREFSPQRFVCGPGCQLKRSLSWWGIRDDGTCGCDDFAAQMDAWGAACWDHLEEIVDHLRSAAAARGIPFIAPAARMMVARAIEAAGREVAHVQVAPEKGPEADPRGAR